ncbi:hypothetical protein QBC38DRAFT_429682 [Podospora fimiseda]|uniref:Fungal STAND N-terminal Goodbye domain-containing protein n=1 Tax=Podospora fimiseda TaxID=252190 RepID=A0AAN6YKS4_9PEZI|nr:hypothetical protein QBC38DRAFT_429682 [Podospora fimiseda]
MSSAMFADPEMVQLWDEAVKAHREKTAVDLKNEQNKNKTQIFIKFWISLKPATSTSSSPSTPEKEPESPVNPSKAQERELVDELTREHEMFQKLRNDGGKVAKTREYLGRYASTMASIGPVLESVVEDAFPPAAMVAVAFTHIVTSFVAVSDDLNLIENLFDIMTSFAERLSLLRKIPKERRFRNLILKTFTCMLEFCTSAHYRLQKDNYRIRAWAKALFKGQDEKLKESYDRVITAIDDMGKATVTQILAVALEIQDDTERTLQRGFSRMDSGFMKMNNGLNLVLTNQRHETQRNQRRDKETRGFRAEIRKNNDKIINILLEKSTSKSGSEARKVSSLEIITKSLFTGAEYFLAQRWAKMEREFVKDTFTWFDKDYEKLKEMDGGVMFISGASGMGKSFFSFAVMSRLAKDFEDVPSTSVASFMFDQDNEKLETIRSMLYFCSAQVASTDDSYRQHVQKVVDNLDDTKGDWKADPWKHLFADKFQKDDKLPAKLFLILDGIDQLEEEPELRRLVEIINDQKSQGLRINFVISGTPEMVGEERIPEALIKKKIHLIPETMAPDFKLFAKSQLESVQGLAGHRPALKERIAEALEENADTFFYVTYFLRQLEIMRISSLVENSIVHALPESTEAIYQRLFQECEQYFPDSNQKKALGYLFTWLAYSYHKITLIAAQNLIDLIMVSILGEKESTLNIRIETMGRLSRLLAFSEPFDEAPPMSPGDSDNANEQNGLGANGRNRRKNEKAEPEVLLTWQQHSLRDYFNKHPEKSSSFLRPTKHETSVMMFKMAVAILAAPKRKSKRQMSEGERNLETIAAHCVFGHLSDAQPLQSEDEIASVAQSLYTLLGQGDGALEKIEANFEFAEDSPDATDYCSIFVPPREIEESSRETVLPTVDRILQSLLDLGSRVAKLPTEAKVQISADASYWIRTTLESRYSILTSIAMGHIRNWFSDRAVSPSKAFAAFRFAHVALWTLTKEERNKLVETTGVKFTDEDFPEDLRDDFPDRTFELVASLGGNPLGPRDHKQISKALQFDLRNKGSKEQAEKGLKEAKDPREIFDLRYRIARAHFDECVYPEPISSPDSNTQPVTPESVLQAWETCLKEIPTTDPDGSLQIMLNVAYQIKARVESMIEGAQSKALVSMQEAAKRKTPESFPRFFEELVVAFGERGLWNEIVQLLGYYDNPLTVKCRDMTHRFIQRAAMATGKQGIVRDYYIKAANAPDEFNGADESEVRIWLASFEWFVMQDQDRAKNAKEQLKHVLKSKQSGFLWSEKAGRKLADILLEEFRMSRQLSYKTDRLAEMEEVILSLRDRLGLEFKPKLSQTSTTLASMRRKLGPAHTFYQSLNDTFEAACEALNDMTETNDTPSLRLLAKVLSLVPGRTQDAQIALSCQFYLLPSRKSSSSSDPNAPGIKIVGTGSSGLVQTTQPPRRTPSPTKRSSPNRTPSPSKRGGSASPNSRTPSPASAEKSEYDFNKHTQIECAACNKTISSFTKGRIYMCVYCTNVDLCEECYYKRLRYYGKSQEGVIGLGFGLPVESEVDRKSYVEVCPWGHELIEAPVKGWKGVRGEMLEFGDEVVGFQDWLDGLRKKWEQSWRVYWREVDDE